MGSYVHEENLVLFERSSWGQYLMNKFNKISIKLISILFLTSVFVSGLYNSFVILTGMQFIRV